MPTNSLLLIGTETTDPKPELNPVLNPLGPEAESLISKYILPAAQLTFVRPDENPPAVAVAVRFPFESVFCCLSVVLQVIAIRHYALAAVMVQAVIVTV